MWAKYNGLAEIIYVNTMVLLPFGEQLLLPFGATFNGKELMCQT